MESFETGEILDVEATIEKLYPQPQRPRPEILKSIVKGQMYTLLDTIGAEHRQCTFANYIAKTKQQKEFKRIAMLYSRNIDQHWKDGNGLVFFGLAGTGKDHMVMAVAKSAFESGYGVVWINGPTFRARVRDAIRGEETEEAIYQELVAPDFLWLSDPTVGGQALTPYQMEFMYRIVDARSRYRKPIWLTANFHNALEFACLVGAATFDRLRNRVVSYHCDWETARNPLC